MTPVVIDLFSFTHPHSPPTCSTRGPRRPGLLTLVRINPAPMTAWTRTGPIGSPGRSIGQPASAWRQRPAGFERSGWNLDRRTACISNVQGIAHYTHIERCTLKPGSNVERPACVGILNLPGPSAAARECIDRRHRSADPGGAKTRRRLAFKASDRSRRTCWMNSCRTCAEPCHTCFDGP